MEKPLDRQLDDIMGTSGVTGVICADSGGFCVGAKGQGSRRAAGLVSSLTQQAAKLHPEESHAPVIVIESDAGNMIIKQHKDISMAIMKAT